MNEFIGSMVTRTIYAYVAEIILGPGYDKEKDYWYLIVEVIWNDNGCPIRSLKNMTFKTEQEARNIKIGTCVDSQTKYSWIS